MAVRRACADEYAVRVNRAVELLADLAPADAVRGLQAAFGLSERQARRYVNEALARPDGVVVPERTVGFTVRLAPSLIAGLRERARAGGVLSVEYFRHVASRWFGMRGDARRNEISRGRGLAVCVFVVPGRMVVARAVGLVGGIPCHDSA